MPRNFLPSLRSPKEGNLYGYFLPKALVNLTLTAISKGKDSGGKEHWEIFLKVNGLKHVPDPDHYYHFKYQPSSTAEDDIVVKYGPKGFLSQVHTKVDDQTDEIISSLSDILGTLGQPAKSSLPAGVLKQKGRGLGSKSVEIFSGLIDPFSEEDIQMLNDRLHGPASEEGPSDESASNIPLIPDVFKFEARILGRKQDSGYTGKENNRSGIFCKPRALVEIGIFGPGGKETEMIEVPHPHMLEFIEIPTASLVKTEFEITFNEDGYPTYIHINKPSTALALVQMPISILRSIFEIPATIFQFRINMNNTKAQAIKSDYDYQKAVLDYANKLKEAEQSNQQSGNAHPSGTPASGGG